MKKDMMVYINDIVQSMNLIEDYITDLTYEKFEESFSTQDAVIRRLQIIGEATSKLTMDFRAKNPGIPWKKIVGLRNIVVHDYSDIDLKTIWEIINEDLPETKKLLLLISSAA